MSPGDVASWMGIGFALISTLCGGVWALSALFSKVGQLRLDIDKHIKECREDKAKIVQKLENKVDK